MSKHIEKFGKVCENVWKIEGLSTQEKKDLIDQIGDTILEAIESGHAAAKKSFFKLD
mgnify:FL=1